MNMSDTESKKSINVSTEQIQTSLKNINVALNKAQKMGAYDMQEVHQLYEDLQLINILVLNYNNAVAKQKGQLDQIKELEND
jgi:hypothetical protein